MPLRTERGFEPAGEYELPRRPDGTVDPAKLDVNRLIAVRGQDVREKYVAVEQIKMLREQIKECYHVEGVNHYENCRELVLEYKRRIDLPRYGALKGLK